MLQSGYMSWKRRTWKKSDSVLVRCVRIKLRWFSVKKFSWQVDIDLSSSKYFLHEGAYNYQMHVKTLIWHRNIVLSWEYEFSALVIVNSRNIIFYTIKLLAEEINHKKMIHFHSKNLRSFYEAKAVEVSTRSDFRWKRHVGREKRGAGGRIADNWARNRLFEIVSEILRKRFWKILMKKFRMAAFLR